MLDPELKQEFEKIDKRFEETHGLIESLAVHMIEGFQKVDERFEQVDNRFDRLEVKLQNQIDGIAERKVDRSEFAPIKAQVLNLQKR